MNVRSSNTSVGSEPPSPTPATADVVVTGTTEQQQQQQQEEEEDTKSPRHPHLDDPHNDIDLKDAEDDEVLLAMEMAIAASKNPHLSAAELRKLLGERNQQLKIVSQLELEKQVKEKEKQEKEKEEAQKRWNDQKEKAYTWWSTKKAAVAQKAEELKFEAEKQYYAEEIKKDRDIIAIRKKMKVCRKTLKAHRLQGNRVETRHTFKRQRMEKNLMALNKKLKKQTHLLTNTAFNVQEYAKAMMKASRKWHKKGSKQELALEAQLCRNMHQMLAIEKQKAKLKKSTREIKKFLQRCKGWLSDKKAFCEMHIITLDATANSMKFLYEETLAKQDALIARLQTLEEFRDADLASVDLPVYLADLETAPPGPRAMLNALRGLPIRDSVRLSKEDVEGVIEADTNNQEAAGTAAAQGRPRGGPELIIEAGDDCSVSSHLTDSEGSQVDEGPEQQQHKDDGDDDDSECGFDFGNDAPWMDRSASCTSSNKSDSASGGKKPAPKSDQPDNVDQKQAPVAAAAAESQQQQQEEEEEEACSILAGEAAVEASTLEDIPTAMQTSLNYSAETDLYASEASGAEVHKTTED